MGARPQKSRKRRLVRTKSPSGDVRTEYKQRKPSRASCAGCGKNLHGVANEIPSKMRHMPKTAKRPECPSRRCKIGRPCRLYRSATSVRMSLHPFGY